MGIVLALFVVSCKHNNGNKGKTEYTVSFQTNGGVFSVDKVLAEAGKAIKNPGAPTKSGYTFDGWYKDSELKTKWDFTNDKVTGDMTLYAKWISSDGGNEVTFVKNNGQDNQIISYNTGGKIDIADPQKEDFVFGGWYRDAQLTDEWDMDTGVTSAMTLYAKWDRDPAKTYYTVTFTLNDGTVNNFALDAVSGKTVSRPADPVRDSFTFDGWFRDNGTFGNEWIFDTSVVTENTTLYAKWTAQAGVETFNVTFVPNDGGELVIVRNIPDNGKVSNPGLTRFGYNLDGWYRDALFATARWDFDNTAVTKDEILYAKWEHVGGTSYHSVTFVRNDGSNIYSLEVASGGLAKTVEPDERDGFIFGGWYTDNGTFSSGWNLASDKVTSNVTLYGKWVETSAGTYYDVTIVRYEGISLEKIRVLSGRTVNIAAAPEREGFTFEGWFTSITGTAPSITYSGPWNVETDTVTGNMDLYAKWAKIPDRVFRVVAFSINDMVTNAYNIEVEAGTPVSPIIPTRDGYVFAGWFTEAATQTEWNFASPVPAGALPFNLYAKWIRTAGGSVHVNFTGFVDEEIDISASSGTIHKGESLTITVTGDFDACEWWLNGKLLAGENGETVTIATNNETMIGEYHVMAVVTPNGSAAPYSKKVTYTVGY